MAPTPKPKPEKPATDGKTAAEYDFSKMKGGVRGKYYKAYREGHTVSVSKEDGTVEVKYFQLEDGAVMLEPGIREYFPDSEAVNRALRALIAIAPKKSPGQAGEEAETVTAGGGAGHHEVRTSKGTSRACASARRTATLPRRLPDSICER